MKSKILEVKNLKIVGKNDDDEKVIIDDISFCLERGEILGIVGESGSGKTILVKGILNSLPHTCKKTVGDIFYEGKNIYSISSKELKKIRGFYVSMISDNPYEILDPIMTVDKQIKETLLNYSDISSKEATKKEFEIFKALKMPDPEKMMHSYPYQLSGGMQQRVSIALTLCGDVNLIIADDATRSLDVTVAAQILEMLREMNIKNKLSMLWITHSLPTCAILANRIMIIHDGKIIEMGPKEEILKNPKHFYTKVLMEIAPDFSDKKHKKTNSILRNNDGGVQSGCYFSEICNKSFARCFKEKPELVLMNNNHWCRCFLYENER